MASGRDGSVVRDGCPSARSIAARSCPSISIVSANRTPPTRGGRTGAVSARRHGGAALPEPVDVDHERPKGCRGGSARRARTPPRPIPRPSRCRRRARRRGPAAVLQPPRSESAMPTEASGQSPGRGSRWRPPPRAGSRTGDGPRAGCRALCVGLATRVVDGAHRLASQGVLQRRGVPLRQDEAVVRRDGLRIAHVVVRSGETPSTATRSAAEGARRGMPRAGRRGRPHHIDAQLPGERSPSLRRRSRRHSTAAAPTRVTLTCGAQQTARAVASTASASGSTRSRARCSRRAS